ncbi:MAG TPA: carbohydrate-binding protein [Pseudonocardiaceae bacterium]|nr:carbohydrate-binding protein [Pseudonocardiaceae bacterium]
MRRSTATATIAAVVATAGAMIALAGPGSATTTTAVQPAVALSNNWYAAAPYVMPLDNNPPDLPTVMAATGQKSFELAFVLSDGGCGAAWDGTSEVASDTTVGSVINSVRAAGGDVSVSFGGFNGTKLGQVCGSAAGTAAAEQAVINKYSLHAIDLDLEEPEYENTTAINNEIGAAQILQADNPGLYISITTAGTAAGTGFFGQNVLNTAKAIGFTPSNFSIMPFDGGFSGASSQIAALNAFHTLLMNTFGWTSATAFAREGFSGMNGRTDSAEFFLQADFQSVLNYATTNGLGRFTFWSLNRDRQCAVPDDNGSLSGTCSSVAQASWDFTRFDVTFAGAAPVTPPPPVSSAPPTSPPPAGGSGSCAAAWNSGTAYVGGSQVSFNGHDWTAQWWTFNDTPGGAAGVWVDNGAC